MATPKMFVHWVLLLLILHGASALLSYPTKGWKDSTSKWVDIWTSMPQLTEPANLPPPPFL